jgi:5-methylthioadenosine/S-adenosylhomocysteine deaminase
MSEHAPFPCDTLVRCGWLLPQDRSDPDRAALRDHGLALREGRVVQLGPWDALSSCWRAAETLDLSGCLVLPGLVNAHTHASMTLFRGLADDLPLMQWLTERIWPIEKRLTREMVRLGALLACAEMLATGTTCFADMYLYEDEVARAVDASGMRAVLSEGILGTPTKTYDTPEEACELARAHHAAWQDHPRVRFCVAAHTVYTTSVEIAARSLAVARDLDAPWMIHLAESAQETERCVERFGMRPLACLERAGVLEEGGRCLLVHCVDLDADEQARLAASGAHVCHNPRSNFKLANGLAPMAGLDALGANLCLGTDGAASNNGLNMFAEMGAAALGAKARELDPTVLPAQRVLDMATLGGAAALAWPELGSLAPGGAADLTALDLSRPGLLPLYNPTSHAVYAAHGGEVRLTMVAGRALYRDGTFPDLDYPALLRETESMRDWIAARVA